ncbi:MAG TPA: hypothetical protein VK421_06100 [Pyrinomonadaceae bacterium]|nr:hypothetical protein [Pyrinomonadaceae bacterium]
MKLQIISDGTRKGTKLVADGGGEVEGVLSIEWTFNQEESLTTAKIEIEGIGLEIVPEPSKDVL